jgi:hypothetical protein
VGARWAAAGCGRVRQHSAVTQDRQHSAARFGFKPNQIYFKRIQFCPIFDRSIRCLPLLEKLEIKYGWNEVEMGNNASYRNLSRFKLKFELKLKEVSLS